MITDFHSSVGENERQLHCFIKQHFFALFFSYKVCVKCPVKVSAKVQGQSVDLRWDDIYFF